MNNLIKKLTDHIDFEEQELQSILAYFKPLLAKKGELLLRAGEVSNRALFIEEGCLNMYQLENGKVCVVELFLEGEMLAEPISFLKQTPTHCFLEAVENSTLYEISHANIYKLYQETYKWDRFVRLIMENGILRLFHRLAYNQALTNEQRYLLLQKEKPKLFERVPQYLIASYLSMTPEGLSKMRRRLTKNKQG